MLKDIITSQVTNGKLEEHKGKAVKHCLTKHEGRIVQITVETYYPTISSKQNRFLHGVFLPALWNARREAGEQLTQEDNRQDFKERFGPHEATRQADGRWAYEPKSIAAWTTKETEDAMEECRAAYATFVELPFPDPEYSPTN